MKINRVYYLQLWYKYYKRYYIFTPIFYSSSKILLDSLDIHTICSFTKLIYWYLELYTVKKQIGSMLYMSDMWSLDASFFI